MSHYKKLVFGVVLLALNASCRPGDFQPDTTAYHPLLVSRESLEKSIEFKKPTSIGKPAKIYTKDRFIYVSEREKGVHVIDNTDPTKPILTGYIAVLGCVDMAIKDNTLYVDNAVDMVAIDISNINTGNIKVSKRVKEIFPELSPPDGKQLPIKYLKQNRPANTVLVSWEK